MSKSEKSVVILGSAYPLRGGLANYNERIARAYMQQGYTVKIITFSLQYPNFLFPGTTQYSEEAAPADLDIEVKLNSVNPLSWFAVGNQIRKINPDLLIIKFWLPFMGPSLGTVARIAKRGTKIKVISIIDNIIPHEKRIGDHLLAKYFVGAVDGFISMSQSVLDDLNTFDKNKPKIFTPHPVYDNFGIPENKLQARKNLQLDAKTPYILFFGFIRDYKGLDLLFKAMADERIRNSEIKLIVAGEYYSNEQKYLDLISKLKIEDQLVLVTDFIPDSKVGDYFNACDMVVQPYKTATQSGVTQIAYHFEKPMLVTKVGGLPEIVPDGIAGYVVDVDPVKIADAILDYFDNNKEKEMVAGCKEEKKKYLWETLLEKIDELL
ncbi:MAG: glycosyl transferase family 1 [Bacteroidetes bacterium]|nr:MAG: glycosyl transferase family 1 [Bacteroidota bacterium]